MSNTPKHTLEVVATTKVGEIFPPRSYKKLITFDEQTPTGTVLTTLKGEQILSAPITNAQSEIVGVADMQKIMLFAVGLHPNLGADKITPLDNLTSVLQEFEQNALLGYKFSSTPIGDVVKGVDSFHKVSPVFKITPDETVERLLDFFYQGVHRVLLVNEKGGILSQISQSDFLAFLAQNLLLVHQSVRMSSIEQLNLLVEKKHVISHKGDIPALHAMHTMVAYNISALPIVDEQNRVVKVLTAANICHLNKYNFGNLTNLTVDQFLKEQMDLTSLHDSASLIDVNRAKQAGIPLTFRFSDSFQTVVTTMATLKAHHAFIVDPADTLLNVLSLGDLFQIFLPWGANQRLPKKN